MEATGQVSDQVGKYSWVVEALGWASEHPTASAFGTFTTVGSAAAASASLSAGALGTVGLMFGLIAGGVTP